MEVYFKMDIPAVTHLAIMYFPDPGVVALTVVSQDMMTILSGSTT